MDDWFDARKAAQVAAFFCQQAGGVIDVLKLTKLIYIADRTSMQKSGFPITNDLLVSMPHGPVNSMTLNHIDGNLQSDDWSDLLSGRTNYQVGLRRALVDSDRDELSDFDLEVLEKVWGDFGGMGKYALRDWTHNSANCPEWENPLGSSFPIPHERVLKYLGIEAAELVAQEIEASRHIDAAFRRLGA